MTSTREWMYKIDTSEFYDGIEEYIKKADTFARSKGFVDGTIQCPCNKCNHLSWKGKEDAKYDLYRYGFVPNYYVWDKHGEKSSQRPSQKLPNRAKAVNLARNIVIDGVGS
ncbi:putative reverse transcriptase, RNA-dependent DNA polymerase, LTR copia-type gag-polypeptide [Tanacetum coccineum]